MMLLIDVSMFIFASIMAYMLGKERGSGQGKTINLRCSSPDLYKELVSKNRTIHHLEKRIHRLKKANRNLRNNLKITIQK